MRESVEIEVMHSDLNSMRELASQLNPQKYSRTYNLTTFLTIYHVLVTTGLPGSHEECIVASLVLL